MVNNPTDYPPIQTDSLKEFVTAEGTTPSSQPYACEDDLIEVMFAQDSKVRLRKGALVDLATNALAGVDDVLQKLAWFEWYRICDVPEERVDEIQSRGEANTGKPVYNLNNIYRLRIPKGLDVWAVSKKLEALPGIILARPVPRPIPPPFTPPNYVPQQGYLDPASSTPTGIDAEYAWTQLGGNGAGVTVCDLEYDWNYNHADITKAPGSQINPNQLVSPYGNNHGTAVIGALVSDNNGWGTTGICYGANLKTCGTVWIVPGSPPDTVWNVAGAIVCAIANLSAGDVILLEQQWDYVPDFDYFIPIEWWTSISPDPQTFNAVYASIVNAVSNGIQVVEAGGNGYFNTDALTWYGNSGAIIVGAGGVFTGGGWPYDEGDLQKLSFSSYGSRFDLQGWGENVVTTGYGNLYNADGANYYYISGFSGTSSASVIVAGAVACCVGYWKANISATPPTPAYLRTALVNTGTPQVTPPYGNIGPRPDLQAVFVSYLPVGQGASGPELTAFQNAYINAGGPSVLGCPINTVRTDGFTSYNGTVGHYQTFDNGSIQYLTNGSYAGQAFAIVNPLYTKWASLGFSASNPLGYPISDLSSQSTSCYGTNLKYQRFEGGALEWHLSGPRADSVYEIHGAIFTKWGEKGSANCPLGLPISDERDALPSGAEGFNTTGRVSDFEGGHIHWATGASEAFETHGSIDFLYVQMGGTASWLGFPISDEYVDGYARNDFEGGYITTTDGVNYQAFPYDDVREIDEGESPPSNFVLFQNYPNPFNPTTNIEFLLAKSGQVKIEIFNIRGQKVKTLVDQYLKAGHKLVDWDGKDDNGNDVSSGIYFYRLQAGDYKETKRMVLLK